MIPATYNMSYYSGDTLTFFIAPKDQSGNAVEMDGATPSFVIADARGDSPSFSLVADAALSDDDTTIKCTISAVDGATLTGGQTYVYDIDVEFTESSTRYTYLTGNITVIADVVPL